MSTGNADMRERVITLEHRVRELEIDSEDHHRKIGRLVNVQIGSVGEDGKNGRLGRLGDDVDALHGKLRSMGRDFGKRITDMEKLGVKITAYAAGGGFVAGLIATLLPYLLGWGG